MIEPVSAVLVIDLLWAHVTPAERIEHISAVTEAERIGVALFVLARDRDEATACAHIVCSEAVRASPLLSDWRITIG